MSQNFRALRFADADRRVDVGVNGVMGIRKRSFCCRHAATTLGGHMRNTDIAVFELLSNLQLSL